MNILLINYEYPPIGGGAGNATHFTGKALADLGHQVSILTTAWQEQKGETSLNNVHLYRIPAWRSDPSSASTLEKLHFIWKAKPILKHIVKQRDIEAAIIYFTIPCGLLASTLKIPYIISLRGGDVPGLVAEIDWIHNLITPARRKILSNAQAVVANAEGLANLSRKADPTPVEVIPNGVDTDFFHPINEERQSKDCTDFLFVGRFHPQKNLHVLMSQMARLKKESSKAFVLHLVGNGPLEEDLKAHAKKLNIEAQVEWHGWLEKSQLRELHQKCDVFINPSHYEGLPNAVLEAMASGLTIIVSDVPGNKDLISEGAGYVYPHGDHEKLFLAISKAHQQEETDYPKTARDRAIKKYSWKKVAQQYVELF